MILGLIPRLLLTVAILLGFCYSPAVEGAPARKSSARKKKPAAKNSKKKTVKRRPVRRKPVARRPVLVAARPAAANSLRQVKAGEIAPRLGCSRQALEAASSLQGLRYRRGGTSPDTGFDCSGFVQYVYRNSCEVDLPRTAQAQFGVGTEVGREDLREGDLVFFKRGAAGWHVGIYSGDGQFIHSPNTRDRVRYSSLSTPYFQRSYLGARRLTMDLAPVLPETVFPPAEAVEAEN
ncbi:MAG: NlpC/P60 family protein [Acidobacteria bacterium]|nr:NlpC/P60 family protein [Acidobacteriota bacterium]